MRLDRAWIERSIPHHGSMCLLEEVISWDDGRISCSAVSHRAQDNPLRAGGRLGIACGIEYAAQAMAVHGALSGGALRPAVGYLAGVRDVRFHVGRLDDVEGVLICDAMRLAGDAVTALYEFALRTGDRCLLAGRATVLLEVRPRIPP